ncbi:MAG: hypothetical protein OCC45_02440 [Desulfotalea sp.]
MKLRERSVLHLNVADFAVAVEQVVDKGLRGKPVIISHPGATRAVVHDMSEEAFQDGVRKGMPLQLALKLSRRACLLPPRFTLYGKAMTSLIKEANQYTPIVEYGRSDGHLYLDVTGTHRLWGPPPDIGLRLQREMRKHLDLFPIWTYSSNKLVAKVASRLVKPVGEYIVAPGEEAEFLAPLPLSLLPDLKEKEYQRAREFNLSSIGFVANMTPQQLLITFGKRAEHIHQMSKGIDLSPVCPASAAGKAIRFHYNFADDTNDKDEVRSIVRFFTGQAAEQLRKQGRGARRIGIWLTYSDGSSCIRNATSKSASSANTLLQDLALQALQRAWTRRVRIRSLEIACDLFQKESGQLSLFSIPIKEKKETKVTEAVDAIKKRFGSCAITSARQQVYREKLENSGCML